ncbi:MAG: hybrid sensor histidine kinase/response regulator [Balneola sp.]|nr:MAG: hybrid sensor histidine kinase/response regulator [Balneola sp.]
MHFQLNPSEFLILIVDDTETNIKLLSHVLRGEGFTPIVAFNGTDAIELIKSRKPELVLLDIMMPDMTGYEVCRIIKADESLSSIPIIFLSALSETSDKVEGFEAGGVDYITKPYQKDEVLARIRTHLVLGKLQKEREERIEILRNRELELQELNSKKDQLVRIVSHDIKNPLTGIVGLANLIRNTPSLPEEEVNKMLGVMESSGKKLMDLVKKVLDSESESSSKDNLKLSESYLNDLGEKVISVNQPKAILKDITLNLIQELAVPKVILDHTKIEIALNNLVSNALKFTPREGIVALHINSDQDKVLFKVEDNGVGISDKIKNAMFGGLDSGNNHSDLGTEGEVGTGLGLEVVEKYVNMHKGKVWVESQEGAGSTFFIELPINQ